MVFKVDFEKAFDSLSWEYLHEIMEIMGFSSTWFRWIMELLSFARASVLVNGSPTQEFQIQRGLRHRDPLSPFLFILAMEGLHIALTRAQEANIFRGISVVALLSLTLCMLMMQCCFLLGLWKMLPILFIFCDVFSWLRVLKLICIKAN